MQKILHRHAESGHSLPRWQAPYDLIDDRFPIRPGTRT